MKRAAAYARFSDERQNEYSNEDQLEIIYDYAKKHGYKIIKTYKDDALSGFLEAKQREGLNTLLKEAKDYDIQYILVWNFDRLARSRRVSQNLKKECKDNGIEVISVTQKLPKGATRILVESAYESVAEWYSWQLAENVMRGMIAAVKRGSFAGRHAPFGYKTIRDENYKRKFIIDDEAAPIVVEMFNKYLKGATLAELARWINAKGYKTTRGNLYSVDAISWILKNPIYKGILVFNDKGKKRGEKNPFREKVVIEHPELTIVSPDVWEEVQKLRQTHKGMRSPKIYLLKHLIRCKKCGHYITRGSRGHNKRTKKYSSSPGKNYYCNWCKKHYGYSGMVGEKKLNKIVIDYVLSIFNEAEDNIELFTEKVNEKLQEKKQALEIPELNDKLSNIEKRILNITDAIETGKATDILLDRLEDLEEEKRKILKRVREVKAIAQNFQEIKPHKIKRDFEKWRKTLLGNEEEAHKLLKELVAITFDHEKKVIEITIFNITEEVAIP